MNIGPLLTPGTGRLLTAVPSPISGPLKRQLASEDRNKKLRQQQDRDYRNSMARSGRRA